MSNSNIVPINRRRRAMLAQVEKYINTIEQHEPIPMLTGVTVFDQARAYYWALNECHSGENSREHKALVRLRSYYRPRPTETPLTLVGNTFDLYIHVCRELMSDY